MVRSIGSLYNGELLLTSPFTQLGKGLLPRSSVVCSQGLSSLKLVHVAIRCEPLNCASGIIKNTQDGCDGSAVANDRGECASCKDNFVRNTPDDINLI